MPHTYPPKIQRVEDSEWQGLSLPDVYFTRDYSRAASLTETDVQDVILLRREDSNGCIYLPLILKRIPKTDTFDATSAYGYGGPWVEGQPSTADFFRQYHDWAVSKKIVTSMIRFHPMLLNAEAFANQLPLEHIGPTVQWDTGPHRDLVTGMAKGHRKSWRRAARTDIEVDIIDRPQDLDTFKNIYEQSMNRVGAKNFYHFPNAYWDALTASDGIHLVQFDANFDSRIQASILAFAHAPYLHVHLSGTTDEGRTLGASHLCRVAAAQWAQSNGLTHVHSGGGLGGQESSLLRWKHGFDPSTPLLDYSIARLIHDRPKFDSIAANFPPSEYFPPWRGG